MKTTLEMNSSFGCASCAHPLTNVNTRLALDWLLPLLAGLALILVFMVVLCECLRRNIVIKMLSRGAKVDLDCVDGVENLKIGQ